MTIENYLNIDYVECYEDYDRQILTKILSTGNLDKSLEKILKQINKNSTIKKGNKVKYELNVVCKNNRLGRFYPVEKNCSIGRIWNEVRSSLMHTKYWDLDMVNCHYYICSWYAEKNGIDCDYINQYINQRENILSLISNDRDYSKKIMLKILYGGNVDNDLNEIYNDWEQNDFIELINLNYKTFNKEAKTFIALLEKEIQQIHQHIYDRNYNCQEFSEILKVCNKKKKKVEKSLVALVLQSYERALLLCIKEKLEFEKRNMDVLIHDGGLVRKLDDEDEFPLELISKCEEYVKVNTGIQIKLAIKPMIYDDDLDLEELDEYQLMKIEFEKTNCKILFPRPFYISLDKNLVSNIQQRKDMTILHEDKFITYYNKNKGKTEEVEFFKLWCKDPNKVEYQRTTFQPNYDNKVLKEQGLYNMWKCWKIDREPIETDLEFTTTFIYQHIWNVWCKNDYKIYNWIMMFLNNLIFHTYHRPNVALIIHSARQGAGKSSIFEEIIAQILGDDYCAIVGTSKKAFAHFNAHIANKCLIVVNETSCSDTKDDIETIKDQITAKTIDITPKGVDTFKLNNLAHIVFCSNNDNPIEIPFSDRRFMAISIEDKFRDNLEYTENYKKEITNPIVRKSFYNYLKNNFNSTNFNFKDERVETEYYMSMKQLSIPIHITFINELVNGDHLDKYKASELYDMFKKFCEDGNYRNNYNSTSFGVRIKNIDGVTKKRSNGIIIEINEQIVKDYLFKEYNLT